MAKAKTQYVALLRAINVGGTAKLPMADLRRMFEAAGCDDVRTYIQSGNVVFRATATLARTLGPRISDSIYAKGLGTSKLDNNYIEKSLGVTSTMRGWRTIGKLVEMLG